MTLLEIAQRLGCRLEGDGRLEITGVAAIEHAGPGDLTFLSNPKYARAVASTRASAIILPEQAPAAPCAVLRSPEPYVMFARALALLRPQPPAVAGVHRSAVIEDGASVAAAASVGAFVFVGAGAEIGADCIVHAHVSIREAVTIGNRVVLQDGAVIGSDGFGFATRGDGTHEKIPQLGSVVIDDDVEIGANSTVDRPPLGATRIGRGTKIDNLVQVAHGVDVGEDVFLAAQVGIAGSTRVGDRVVLAGQVGVSGHITIGHGARATAQTGIPNSVPPGAFVSGYPAIENREWLKASAIFKRLPEMRRALNDLQERIERLEAAAVASAGPPDR